MTRKRNSEEAGGAVATESKQDKFRRLGNRRLANAIKSIRNLARLGNRSAYEYTDEQVSVLFDALSRAWDRLKMAFAERTTNGEEETRYF